MQVDRITGVLDLNNPDKRFVVTTDDFPLITPIIVSKALGSENGRVMVGSENDRLAIGFNDFIRDLMAIPETQAVAFWAFQEPGCPITIAAEVFAPIGNIVGNQTYRAISRADASLARKTADVLTGGLRLVDSTGADLHSLEDGQRQQWQEDGETLLAFLEFKRD